MSLLTDLRQLLLPRLCPVCGEAMMEDEDMLCLRCAVALPRYHVGSITDNALLRRVWDGVDAKSAFSLLAYNRCSPYCNLIHDIKYRGHSDLGVRLGRWAAEEAARLDFWQDVDVLVPVPLTPWRRFRRGFNQAGKIAEGMSEVCGLPVADLLRRAKHRGTQTLLNARQRATNAEGVYRAVIPDCYRGKRLVIVDDVMTTGATLRNCARALLQADGQAQISLFPLASGT